MYQILSDYLTANHSFLIRISRSLCISYENDGETPHRKTTKSVSINWITVIRRRLSLPVSMRDLRTSEHHRRHGAL